jgi:hypothetical protein
MEKSPVYKLEEKLLKRRSSYYRTRRYSFILGVISLLGVVFLFNEEHPDIFEMIDHAIKTTIFFFGVSFYGHVRIQHIESIMFYRNNRGTDS